MINAQEAIQLFELDAVDDWKDYYNHFIRSGRFSSRRRLRRYMKQIRREAALERIVARQQREIEAQARQLLEAQANILVMAQRIEALQAPNYTCQACGHFASDHDFDHGHPCGQCECTGYQSPADFHMMLNSNVGIRHTEYEGEYETPLSIALDGIGDEVEA